jgi:transposase-like protein
MGRARKYYTRQERERLLAEYRAGGAAPASFAAERGIKPGTFQSWLRRHPGGSTPSVKFVAVDVADTPQGEIEIRIGDVDIRVSTRAGAAFVAELVTRLAKASC